jgi:hypothetical protein
MRKNRALWIGLLCVAALCPAAKAQNQRTVSELIESIKAQRERELEFVLASPTPLPSPPRTQPTPRPQGLVPAPIAGPTRSTLVPQLTRSTLVPQLTRSTLVPQLTRSTLVPRLTRSAPVAQPTRSAPDIEPETTVALASGSPVAPQSLVTVGPAAIEPEHWPQVLSLSGINAHYSSELMIDRRVHRVDGQELPRDLDGWLILSISERGVCISRQGGSRCLHPPGSTRMTISSAQSPPPASMTGSERLDPGVRP